MHSKMSGFDVPIFNSGANGLSPENEQTQVLRSARMQPIIETPLPASPVVPAGQTAGTGLRSFEETAKVNKRDAANALMLRERCRQLNLSLFFRERDPIRSLGFTSSIGGEGKSFLALLTARILARDSHEPVTLIECNWEHPDVHKQLGIPSTPGLAEWLGGTCEEGDIRYHVDNNLSVIPAGNGKQDAVNLLKKVYQQGLLKMFKNPNELYIVDLPPVITSGYGPLAARMVETVVLVVRSEVVSESMLAETCVQLKDSSIHGVILNRVNSRVPRWIQQLL